MNGESYFIPDEIAHDKRLTWASRLLLSKLYNLTRQGTEEKQVTNKWFMALGFTASELRTSWKQLVELGFVSKKIDRINGNISTVALVNYPPRDKTAQGTADLTIPSDKTAIGIAKSTIGVSLKSQEGYSENDNTPIAKIALHHTKVITNSNNQSNDLSNTIYSANTKNDTQKISYPQSAEECITLFSDYVQRYSSDAPALLNMPLRMQAETFFDYWNERGWKSQRGAVKSVKGCVATWINNWLSHNQRFTSAKPRLNTFEDHIAYGQQLAHKLGFDSDTPPKNADEILDRALELECKKIKPITDPLALEILGRKKAP